MSDSRNWALSIIYDANDKSHPNNTYLILQITNYPDESKSTDANKTPFIYRFGRIYTGNEAGILFEENFDIEKMTDAEFYGLGYFIEADKAKELIAAVKKEIETIQAKTNPLVEKSVLKSFPALFTHTHSEDSYQWAKEKIQEYAIEFVFSKESELVPSDFASFKKTAEYIGTYKKPTVWYCEIQ